MSSPPPGPRPLYVVGAGGMGRETAWLAKRVNPAMEVSLVVSPGFPRPTVSGFAVISSDGGGLEPGGRRLVAVGDPATRRKLYGAYEVDDTNTISLVDPSAVVGENVELMPGVTVCAGVILTTQISVGRHTIINIGSTISHDVRVGEFCTISPGVSVAGNVEIADEAFLGIGCSVINGSGDRVLKVGRASVVAAGAVVTESVPEAALVAGIPARVKKYLA